MIAASRIEACVRIASEYRGKEGVRADSDERLTWRAALPARWAPTFGGKVAQIMLVPLVLPFVMLLASVSSIVNATRGLQAKRAVSPTRPLDATNIHELWRNHGLPERRSSVDFESRCRCLEQWVDLLYGEGTAAAMQVRGCVEERRSSQARAIGASSDQGISISFVDPVDATVRELAEYLPDFR